MEGLTSHLTNNVYNVNRAAEETTSKIDHQLKRKVIDACEEYVHRSTIFWRAMN